MHKAEPSSSLARYQCCICLSNQVSATEHACQDCRDVFLLADGQVHQDTPPRVVVGPTDI
jgi:hypothetical protein